MMSLLARRRADKRALVMGLTLLVLSVVVWRDATAQTMSATYGIGPAAMPYLIAMALVALGLGHIVVAFRDGLPVPEHADGIAIGWIALGLVALLLCIAFGAGFILATTILFAATARAFGRRALLVDAAIGFGLGVAIHLLFSKLLTLSLPAGPIEHLF
ncbi:tripartite tricarboxylate transporter TctB family protein [Microvirga arabica]|uniref:Tripartite tricarboxylate transporter TctB family protein n=1 Tax=Microvirga arabica TaxID=1128671 RepID=A0ABV6Y9T9_9HYPH|nr:tripartite tricarboxylate transporter TctB family protein [Microvirga arabica]MBM1174423.1 tripartite tricarboxylate transporter TctB family protein [Microvirga arabica]